jgi:hypothetical protein
VSIFLDRLSRHYPKSQIHLPAGAETAGILGRGQRALQPNPSEEGTSFVEILSHVAGSDMSLIEISYLPGFPEASSLSRAVKRRTSHASRSVRSSNVGDTQTM